MNRLGSDDTANRVADAITPMEHAAEGSVGQGAGASVSGAPTSADETVSVDRLDGPSPAAQVALDMVKRSLPFAPLAIIAGAAVSGTAGAASVAFGIGLVLANLLLSALLLAWASKISFQVVAAAALGGYVTRLGLILGAVLLVKDQSWVALLPLGVTIIVTHLGLLAWELRFVSASLAYPGLKPRSDVRPVSARRR